MKSELRCCTATGFGKPRFFLCHTDLRKARVIPDDHRDGQFFMAGNGQFDHGELVAAVVGQNANSRLLKGGLFVVPMVASKAILRVS